jgi:ankyrin repeat protein
MNKKIKPLILTIGVAFIILAGNFFYNRFYNDLYRVERAIKEKNNSFVSVIISKNRDLLKKRIDSLSLLHIATMYRNIDAIKILIDNGVDVNVKGGRHNYTPLFNSSGLGDIRAMKMLIGHGANVNERDDFGETPLMAAAEWDRTKAIELLINNNADVNTISSSVVGNRTAIWYAVSEGNFEAFILLQKNKAKYNHGQLLHLAEEKMAKLPKDNKKIKDYRRIISILNSE